MFDRDDNVQRELRDWGLSFDSNLLSFSGRILQAEKIHQGGKTVRRFPGRPWVGSKQITVEHIGLSHLSVPGCPPLHPSVLCQLLKAAIDEQAPLGQPGSGNKP
jgi:hypothetical protein